MNVTMKIMPPIFEENNEYSRRKNRSVFSIKDECRKVTLFRIRVYGLSLEESKQVIHEIRQSLYRPSGFIGLQLLSEESWGYPAEYYQEKRVYEDCIVIPKDFDNPETQLRAILECIAKDIYEYKMQYNPRFAKQQAKKKKTA